MPLVVYTLVRLGLVAVVFVVLWFLGLRGWPGAFIGMGAAVAVSFAVSYLFFGGVRDRAVRWVAERDAARRERTTQPGEDERVEDAMDDAPAGGSPAPDGPVER